MRLESIYSSFLLIVFVAFPIIGHTQGSTCETANSINLGFQPYYLNGNIEANSSGMIGNTGCANFSNLPVQWLKIPFNNSNLTLSITNNSQMEMQIALYRGDCTERTFINCGVLASSINYDPNSRINFHISSPDDYYLQIAYSDGSAGDFDLELLKHLEIDYCYLYEPQSYITVENTSMGSPFEGPFAPGEIVSFRTLILWNSGINGCQYLHGIVPRLGNGWQEIPQFTGPFFEFFAADLNWHEIGLVQYNYNGRYHQEGEFIQSGWFVTGEPGNTSNCSSGQYQFDPNCSFGIQQTCSTIEAYELYFELQVNDNIDCSVSSQGDLSVSLELFSDGETGGYFSNGGCDKDLPIMANYGAQCCDQISVSPISPINSICNNQEVNVDLNNLLNNVPNPQDYSFVYRINSTEPIVGLNNCFGNCGNNIDATPSLSNPNWPAQVSIDISIVNQDGCFVGRYELEFEIRPDSGPSVQIQSSTGSNFVCESPNGFPITLFAETSSSCSNIIEIEWIGPNGITQTGANFTATNPGIYTAIVYDNFDNFSSANYEINYYTEVPIEFSGPTQLCPSDILQDVLVADPPGGTWSGDGVEVDKFYGPVPGDYNINYSYQDINGCISSDNYLLMVTLDPDVSVEAPDFVCVSSSLQDVLIPIPAGGTFDASPILDNGMVIANSPGTYNLTYRYGDPNSACSESFTFDLTIIDQPMVTLEATESEICIGGSGIYDILIPSPLGGQYISNNVNSNGEFVSSTLGSNIVEYQYIDPITGCSNIAITEIILIDGDPISIISPADICQSNTPIQIEATPPGGEFSGNNITPEGLFTPSNLGSETIEYTYYNSAGCTTIQTAIIDVTLGTNITVVHPPTACLNSGLVLVNAFPVGGTYSGNIDQNGAFYPDQIGVNNMVYSYENTQGCITNHNFSIEVLNYVIPQITSLPISVCYSQSDVYQLIAEPAGGTFDGNISASGEFIPNQIGVNTITYGPSQNNECIISTSYDIEVLPELNVFVNSPSSLCRNAIPYDVLEPNIPGGTWTGPVTPDGRFQAFDFGFNEVTYTIDDPSTGCSGSYTFEIEVIETSDLNVPQFLTPIEDSYCIYEIVELCIDPVIDAQSYRWETNFGIIEYASPNRLCARIGWNTLGLDTISIFPIGSCGISTAPLQHPVEIIDDISCIVISTDIKDVIAEKIEIYPNPAKDNIQIESNKPIKLISIYSSIGSLIDQDSNINTQKVNYNLSTLRPGIYFIEVNESQLKKIIILE